MKRILLLCLLLAGCESIRVDSCIKHIAPGLLMTPPLLIAAPVEVAIGTGVIMSTTMYVTYKKMYGPNCQNDFEVIM